MEPQNRPKLQKVMSGMSLFPHHRTRQEKRRLVDPPQLAQEGSRAGGSTVFTFAAFSEKGAKTIP